MGDCSHHHPSTLSLMMVEVDGSGQEGFGSFRFVSVRGNRTQSWFGSCNGRFVSVRVTSWFGSVRFVETASRVGSVLAMAGSFRFA